MNILRGLGTALVTPFKEDTSIDFSALEHLVEHNISGGVDYLVVQGTTGETANLTKTERIEIFRPIINLLKQVF